MAVTLSWSSSTYGFVALVALLALVNPCSCFNSSAWGAASATWYGKPNGAGPADNGGACGFKNVNMPPFSSMTSCGNPALFKSGKGCGACYQVKCTSHPACSGRPSTIVITDACLGGVCVKSQFHFDMSGTAFGSMALPGKDEQLRRAGKIPIQFARVPCRYPGLDVGFHVQKGSNPFYFAVLVEYLNGDGDLSSVDLMEAGSGRWTPLRQSWGAIWRLDSKRPLRGPFSIRVTTLTSRKTLVANNVIPANWQPNTLYRSKVNFNIYS
ncbi:expansin-B7-like [Typha angustifolia]|uniref:expansin-B7-like n=1 Tax=Typha angustifolia TaxID=59011 RepID=UPI003C2C5D1E